jgi:hypothetical protein
MNPAGLLINRNPAWLAPHFPPSLKLWRAGTGNGMQDSAGLFVKDFYIFVTAYLIFLFLRS